MKYRLNKAETVPVTLNHVAKTKVIHGREVITYQNYIRLSPNTEYKTDDKAMAEWFKAYRRKANYSESLERALKANNVPYEIEYCKTCRGRVKKISYQIVEVYE